MPVTNLALILLQSFMKAPHPFWSCVCPQSIFMGTIKKFTSHSSLLPLLAPLKTTEGGGGEAAAVCGEGMRASTAAEGHGHPPTAPRP